MDTLQCNSFALKNNDIINFTVNSNDQLQATRPDNIFVPDPYDVGSRYISCGVKIYRSCYLLDTAEISRFAFPQFPLPGHQATCGHNGTIA
ncbi:hypothetical protein EVAR_13712_1 [Eumeta japonica]|uniref:Uncharacterized protein n=1 Tax=Eumeta variegata TaxID=151549 RepID=A0A4C1UBE3_EUMVA|nr:hypothetical protein EVAR_13712_1 [Eumeta japonica]